MTVLGGKQFFQQGYPEAIVKAVLFCLCLFVFKDFHQHWQSGKGEGRQGASPPLLARIVALRKILLQPREKAINIIELIWMGSHSILSWLCIGLLDMYPVISILWLNQCIVLLFCSWLWKICPQERKSWDALTQSRFKKGSPVYEKGKQTKNITKFIASFLNETDCEIHKTKYTNIKKWHIVLKACVKANARPAHHPHLANITVS